MTGIVLHGAHLGRRAEGVGHTAGGPLVVGGERHADVTIVQDGVVRTVGLLDLVEGLSDQKLLRP
jgi:hypothetical protein